MSASTKITLLALISAAAAVPQYGYSAAGYSVGHSKYHTLRPSGTEGRHHHHHGHGTGKPYPTGAYNGTGPAGTGYGTGYEEATSTTDFYSTTTETIVKTITVQRTSEAAQVKNVQTSPVEGDVCGPATVTVTATERQTVTVQSALDTAPAPAITPTQIYSANPFPYVPSSAQPEDECTESPVASSTPAAAEYSAQPAPSSTPAAAQYSAQPAPSKAESYAVPSVQAQAVYSAASPAPSAAAPATGNSYNGIKRGLAYNDASACKALGGKYGFAYNWGQTSSGDVGAPFVPMMHKPSDSTPEAWLANVDKAVKAGSTAVMGFNECDHSQQCNLSPEAACAAWKQYMNPIKAKYPQVTIIGPSVTNGPADQNMGIDGWLAPFYKACPDAIVDATNIHFYDIYQEKATLDRFSAQVEKAKQFNKKVWVTEYGLNPGCASDDQAAEFLKGSMAYLDRVDFVQGYAYFMVGGTQEHSITSSSHIGALYAASS